MAVPNHYTLLPAGRTVVPWGFYTLQSCVAAVRTSNSINVSKVQGRNQVAELFSGLVPVYIDMNNPGTRIGEGVLWVAGATINPLIRAVTNHCYSGDRLLNLGAAPSAHYADRAVQQQNDSTRALQAAIDRLNEFLVVPDNILTRDTIEGQLVAWVANPANP